MLVDPSLWTTFHRARDALLNALREAPLVNDIYATPSPIKAMPPASTKSLIQAISEAEHEIESAQNELSSVRSYLAHNRAIVTNWSSPLAILPYELIQDIVSYIVVTPGRQREIMRLSHVSKRWREAVLAMPQLFTTANWNTWPHPLIELWCQRAGTQPLNISLGDRAIDQLRDECGSELLSLVNSCTSRWGRLNIYFNDVRLKDKGVANALQRLLQGSTPLLHRLNIFAQKRENETMLLDLHDCPPLNVSLSGVWVLFGACSTSVTDLTLQLSHFDSLSRVVDVLSSCPLIQILKLDLAHYSDNIVDVTRTTQTMLPSLVHLELHTIRTDFVTDIGRILCCFNIPSLNSMTVTTTAWGNNDILPLLEQTIPNAQNISVLKYRPTDWHSSSYELEHLGMEPTIFAHLKELHVLYEPARIYINRYSMLGEVIRDIVDFRKGSITHLTTPPFGDDIVELLRGRVPHFNVGPPVETW